MRIGTETRSASAAAVSSSTRKLVNRREGAPAGRLDEVGQLVGQGGEVAARRAGPAGARRSRGRPGPRSRRGCPHRARSTPPWGTPRRLGRRAGSVALVSTAVRRVHSASWSSPATSRGATRSTGKLSVPSTHTTSARTSPARPPRGPRSARRPTAGGAAPRARESSGALDGTARAAASTSSTRPRATVMAPPRSWGRSPLRRRSRWGRRASTMIRPASSMPAARRSSATTPRVRRARSVNRPAGHLHAAGGRHDVLELVGLVDRSRGRARGGSHPRRRGRGRRGGG